MLQEKRPIATLFVPTNERGVHEGEETFLPGLPEDLMAEGKLHSVPFITGVTTLESIFVLGGIHTVRNVDIGTEQVPSEKEC